MRMKMRHIDTDKFEVTLGSITRDCERAGLDAQRECAKSIKRAVIRRLESIKTKDLKAKEEKIINHMCADVKTTTTKDEYGDSIIKVQGGKKTGTKWHIVNDGTYRSRATHFMDLALNDVDQELESIINQKLKGALGD